MKEKYFINPFTLFLFWLIGSTAVFGQNAVLQFSNQTIQLGKVDANTTYTITVPFKNIGTDPVELLKIDTDCGCSSASWTKKRVGVQEEGSISVTFKPVLGETPFYRNIIIQTDAKIAQYTLSIQGEIVSNHPTPSTKDYLVDWKEHVKAVPIFSGYHFNIKGEIDEVSTIPIYITNVGDKSLFIQNVTCKGFEIESVQLPKTIKKGEVLSFPVKVKMTEKGVQQQYLKVNTDERTILIRIRTTTI
ncbi:DUF1573 domain-containing protein [Flammeovirga agarivorans]|uniref:DUF1573 domain-containing protein n=1 Tax=Flammeovirga agarivorans TaxID=2726742 RepID=A0A7X8XV01_9BACT|nr:DUF1573 domain-containing protein [Flammeovirga agarivorans]NLR90605.1 DUF1573 domain-containing protein [Flammeovirga agarivorans]